MPIKVKQKRSVNKKVAGKNYCKIVSRENEKRITKTQAIEALQSALSLAKGKDANEQDLLAFIKEDQKARQAIE